MNINVLNSWIADNGEYTLRIDYDLHENSIVFDVGCYKGEWAKIMWDKYKCSIHCFEPVPKFYDKLMIDFGGIDKIHIHKYALSNIESAAYMDVDGDKSKITEFEGNLSIYTKRMATILETLQIKKVELLKLNIEGNEYCVLEDMINCRVIGQFDNIQVQFHDFVAGYDKKYDIISAKLKNTHHVTYRYPFVWENWAIN